MSTKFEYTTIEECKEVIEELNEALMTVVKQNAIYEEALKNLSTHGSTDEELSKLIKVTPTTSLPMYGHLMAMESTVRSTAKIALEGAKQLEEE